MFLQRAIHLTVAYVKTEMAKRSIIPIILTAISGILTGSIPLTESTAPVKPIRIRLMPHIFFTLLSSLLSVIVFTIFVRACVRVPFGILYFVSIS